MNNTTEQSSDPRTQLVQSLDEHTRTCEHCSTVGAGGDYCAEFHEMATRLNSLVRHGADIERTRRMKLLAEITHIGEEQAGGYD